MSEKINPNISLFSTSIYRTFPKLDTCSSAQPGPLVRLREVRYLNNWENLQRRFRYTNSHRYARALNFYSLGLGCQGEAIHHTRQLLVALFVEII